MATTAFCSDTPSHLVCALLDYHLFFNRTMTQHTSRLCKGYLTKKKSAASDDLVSTITQPQPNWDGLGWVGPQSEKKAANKCSAYVGTPSRLLEKHSSRSWFRECQECAKLLARQWVATLKNQKYILICLTLLVTTWFHMCYFILWCLHYYSTM